MMKKTPAVKNILKKRLSWQNGYFLKMSFLKCNEIAVLSFDNTHNKENSRFLFENEIFAMFYYFLNKTLKKVYSNLNKTWSTLINEP